MQLCRDLSFQLSRTFGTHLASLDDVVSVLAIVIHNLNVIQICICPVDQLLYHVQCHCGWLLNLIIHKPASVSAIHVAPLQFAHFPIICKEEHPETEQAQIMSIKCYANCILIESYIISYNDFVISPYLVAKVKK